MGGKLVTNHKPVKRLRHLVEIAFGEPGMEGERECALERVIGTGEGTRTAMGAETVECVRADLGFDSLRAQAFEHVVAPLDLNDVCLPAVHVTVVRAREEQR